VDDAFRSFHEAMLAQLGQALSLAPFLVSLLVALVVLRLADRSKASSPLPVRAYGRAVAFGSLLLLLAVFPYAMTKKAPWGDTVEWGTRTLLLVGTPVALLLVSVTALARRVLRVPESARAAVLAALVLSSCWVRVDHYLRFFAWNAEARSFVLNLSRLEGARDKTVLGVVSRVESLPVLTSFYVWTYMFDEAWGSGFTKIGILEPQYRSRRYTDEEIKEELAKWAPYADLRVPWERRHLQATLVVEPRNARLEHDHRSLALAYLERRFRKPEGLDAWLRGLTTVRVSPKE
jgi:hypothetical protein